MIRLQFRLIVLISLQFRLIVLIRCESEYVE
jgi:hypothetical protein